MKGKMCLLYLLLHDKKTTKSGNVVGIGLHLEKQKIV